MVCSGRTIDLTRAQEYFISGVTPFHSLPSSCAHIATHTHRVPILINALDLVPRGGATSTEQPDLAGGGWNARYRWGYHITRPSLGTCQKGQYGPRMYNFFHLGNFPPSDNPFSTHGFLNHFIKYKLFTFPNYSFLNFVCLFVFSCLLLYHRKRIYFRFSILNFHRK